MNEGKSAVGTKLDRDSAAYKALVEKRSYTGPHTVFGRDYQANFAPLIGEDGKLTGALFVGVASVAAAEFGTAEEAKAMLEKVVAAVKQDKAKALDMINNGEGGFKDRDLYAWCANASDGIMTAQRESTRPSAIRFCPAEDHGRLPSAAQSPRRSA